MLVVQELLLFWFICLRLSYQNTHHLRTYRFLFSEFSRCLPCHALLFLRKCWTWATLQIFLLTIGPRQTFFPIFPFCFGVFPKDRTLFFLFRWVRWAQLLLFDISADGPRILLVCWAASVLDWAFWGGLARWGCRFSCGGGRLLAHQWFPSRFRHTSLPQLAALVPSASSAPDWRQSTGHFQASLDTSPSSPT